MKRVNMLIWGAAAGLGLALAGGCGKAVSGSALGGETHWLLQCGSNSDCGGALDCLCGVCTVRCADDASCMSFDANARCTATADSQYASACDAAPERLCVADGSSVALPAGTMLQAQPLDPRGCFGPAVDAGRMPPDVTLNCGEAVTYAYGPDGTCWRFSSTCLPDGFSTMSPSPEAPDCSRAGICPELLDCEPGALGIPLFEGCVSCEQARGRRAELFDELARVYNAEFCESDSDCVEIQIQGECDGVCPLAVNRFSVARMQRLATDLAADFCPDPRGWRETCGLAAVDCNLGVSCRDGRCVPGLPD